MKLSLGLLAALATACGSGARASDRRDGCRRAFDQRDWPAVVRACTDAEDQPRATLGRAWLALQDGRVDEALAIAATVDGSEVAADAAYLAGYAHGRRDQPGDDQRARERFEAALAGYQRAGQHAGTSRAASYLARIASDAGRLDEALALVTLAVDAAGRSGDRRLAGKAETALAEADDAIGLVEDARDQFIRAEGSLRGWPVDLAYAYLKHGLFLLDLDDEHDLPLVLAFLDEARRQVDLAGPSAAALTAETSVSIELNRAVVLGLLGETSRAGGVLDVLARQQPHAERRIALVRGYVAARAGDLAVAEASFRAASLDQDARLDYLLRTSLAIAALHRQAGSLDQAEAAYRAGMATVERMRSAAGAPALRTRVLERRAAPYVGLIEILAAQGRSVEALEVAESLHARTWRDVALQADPGAVTPATALLAARLRQSAPEVAPLDARKLMATIGDREALVYVSFKPTLLRAHVRAGTVTIVALTPDEQKAIAAFEAAPDDAALAARAGELLLPPELAPGERPLHLVAGGRVSSVPFAALRYRGKLLIEQRPLARLPGLSTLGCREHAWTERAVFIGDAASNLPGAAREVIHRGGQDALVGPAATLGALEQARDAALLHVAVHGRVTTAGGTLELADGALSASEVIDRRIAPRVVVLSGCATAASADAEDWTSLPSAFLAVGSQHVVATLRTVRDADAAAVTEAYYDEQTSGGPVARLAAAQRHLALVQPPSRWASFAVWGDPACGAPAPVRAPASRTR